MNALGPLDKKLLSFLRTHMETHGITPSVKEMAVLLGYRSQSYAHHRLETLIAAGYVKRASRRARGLELVQTKDYHLPDCGCTRCSELRYLAQLRLIQGLRVDPPVAVRVVLLKLRGDNIRMLDECTRLEILGTEAAPRKRTAVPLGGGR